VWCLHTLLSKPGGCAVRGRKQPIYSPPCSTNNTHHPTIPPRPCSRWAKGPSRPPRRRSQRAGRQTPLRGALTHTTHLAITRRSWVRLGLGLVLGWVWGLVGCGAWLIQVGDGGGNQSKHARERSSHACSQQSANTLISQHPNQPTAPQ